MLGRLPSAIDPRTLQLSNYLRTDLEIASEPVPTGRRWDTKISDWGVMGNDTYGNCTIVTAAHALLCWRTNELDATQRITDSAVIELSRTMGAINGFSILERLKWWRKRGMWGDRLWAFAAVNPTNIDLIRLTINTFGCADIGLNLPRAWQSANLWDVGGGRAYEPGSWGGHSVPLVGYDEKFVYAVSWGSIVPMTWKAIPVYCDEAYALIDPNWIAADSIAPSGVDLTALHTDLMALQT